MLLSTLFLAAFAQEDKPDSRSETASVRITEEEDLPPDWKPGYVNSGTGRYYYLPDLRVYYDVIANVFVYSKDEEWTASPSLPESRFGKYDLKTASIVPLDPAEGMPMQYFTEHQEKYPAGYRYEPSPDQK